MVQQISSWKEGKIMTQNKRLWKRLRSIRNITAILSVGFAMTGGVISLLGGDALQWLVFAVGFLGVDALMERLDMLSNIEEEVKSTSQAVSEIKKAVETIEMEVITDDTQIPDMVLKIADRVKVKEVRILSSGLTTRQILIAKLLQKGVRVQALIQDPLTALDKKDKERVQTALGWIEHHREFIKSGLFEARYHVNVSTVRAIVITEENTDEKHIFLSWYHYENKNTKVRGDTNPTIYCTTLSRQGMNIHEWLSAILEKDLRESRKITSRDFTQ